MHPKAKLHPSWHKEGAIGAKLKSSKTSDVPIIKDKTTTCIYTYKRYFLETPPNHQKIIVEDAP
jgi:hypothetical protein